MYYSKLLADIGYDIPVADQIVGRSVALYPMEISSITHMLMNYGGWQNIPNSEQTYEMLRNSFPKIGSFKRKNMLAALDDQSIVEFDVPFPPVENPRFTFADIFCNIGGFTMAAKSLGGRPVLVAETERPRWSKQYFMNHGLIPYAHPTWLKGNFPQTDILLASLEIHDVVIGRGPKPDADSIGDTDWYTLIEMINRIRPKGVLIECRMSNWDAMIERSTSSAYRIMHELTGYCMVEPIILNAADFGVPQFRRRLWIAAFETSASGLIFQWPTPQPRVKKIKDILEDEVDAKFYVSKKHQEYLERNRKQNEARGWSFSYEVIETTRESNPIIPGGKGWDKNIIVDEANQPHALPNGKPVNMDGWRRFTNRELARLQGFPEDYVIPAGAFTGWEPFGRATNVMVAKAVIESALKAIDPAAIVEAGKKIIQGALNFQK